MVNETLKQIRVNVLGFSVEEMARKLNMSVSEYERMENERPIPSLILVKVAQAVGMPIEDLLNVQKEEIKFDIKDEWISIYDIERNLSKFLIANREYIDSEPLLGLLKNMVRKPKVAFVGRSDVGKSALINTLLGNDALPVSWTPTTSIIVYVKHIQDKPSYIDDNVLIFHAGEENELWDDAKLQEREYTESFLIASGDYSLLLDYGARQGRKFEDTNAASAVVFVDSDILKNCDLVDLPGYGTGDREMDDSLLAKMKGADILVYMSLANAFMRAEDIAWLQNELPNLNPISLNSSLKPLSNLYIVASQAHTVNHGSISQLDYILTQGAKRFEATTTPDYWSKFGQKVDLETFHKRFFTYSTDQKDLRKEFEIDLRDLLERLPQVIKNDLLSVLKNNVQERINHISLRIKSFRKTLFDRNNKKERLERILANEPARINKNTVAKQKIFDAINQFKQAAMVDFVEEYNRIINKENIVNLINSNDWKKKEEDMKLLGQKLSNLLNDANSSITLRYSEEFKVLVDEYIHDFESETNLQSLDSGINGKIFDFKASFAGGLAGLALYGALAVWAASLGNLGAYILVAKGVSVLAALGIGISGGTAAAISAVAAIGGPVVIAVGLAALVAALFYAIFAANWKETIAKKIVKKYDEKKVLEECQMSIAKYWDDTKAAFASAANNMEKEFKEYLDTLKKEINETNDDEINRKIEIEEKSLNVYTQLINSLTE